MKVKVRLLILNDNSSDIETIRGELEKVDLIFDIRTVQTQSEFVKQIIKFEPEVVITNNHVLKYTAIDAYQDSHRALPFAVFILINSEFKKEEINDYILSGIDFFLTPDNYSFLPFAIMHGLNKKSKEKKLFESQQQMNESKLRLRSVFDNDQNAIFILGFKSEIIDLNPAALHLLGKKNTADIQGKDILKYIDKVSTKKFRTAHASAFRGRKSTDEYTFSVSKKTLKQASINFVPVKNEDGFSTSIMIICKDITETFLFQQKFKLSEKRFVTMANNAPVGIYYNNTDGKCLFVNKKWCEYSGLTFNESLGMGWIKSVHPDDLDSLKKLSIESRRNNSEFSFDYRIVHSSGEIKWMKGKSSPFFDDQGTSHGYIGSITDITNDKLHALVLKASEEKFRYLFNHSPDGIYIEDLNGKIMEVNEQACQLQGMSKEELTGKNILDIAPDALKDEISKKFKKMAQGDITMLRSFSWNKSGKKIPIQIKQNRIEYNLEPALLLHVRKIEEDTL